jgi:hypothetical protein
MLIPIIDRQPDVKEWTQWHTDLKKLIDLVRNVQLDDREIQRAKRKSGSAMPAKTV